MKPKKTVRPHDTDAHFARVICPWCLEVHAYGRHLLAPLPVRAGDARTVACLHSLAEVQRANAPNASFADRYGLYSPHPATFKIQF